MVATKFLYVIILLLYGLYLVDATKDTSSPSSAMLACPPQEDLCDKGVVLVEEETVYFDAIPLKRLKYTQKSTTSYPTSCPIPCWSTIKATAIATLLAFFHGRILTLSCLILLHWHTAMFPILMTIWLTLVAAFFFLIFIILEIGILKICGFWRASSSADTNTCNFP
jgi:hypothetical protein